MPTEIKGKTDSRAAKIGSRAAKTPGKADGTLREVGSVGKNGEMVMLSWAQYRARRLGFLEEITKKRNELLLELNPLDESLIEWYNKTIEWLQREGATKG
jgi:hypothetical protein